MQPVEYKNVKALSQSSLKLLDYSPKKFYEFEQRWLIGELENKPERPVTESMLLGELVDCLLLESDKFDERYIVCNVDIPTGQMLTFTEEMYKLHMEGVDDPEAVAKQAYANVGFKRDPIEKILLRFATEGLPYFTFKLAAIDRQVVDSLVYNKAAKLVQELKDHKFISKILEPSPDKEFLYQLPIYMDWPCGSVRKKSVVKLKGLLDLVVIDHRQRTITPYDLKTSADSSFENAVWKYRYDLQASFYNALLSNYVQSLQYLSGYTIKDFKFIVCSTVDRQHEIWNVPNEITYAAAYDTRVVNGKIIRGWCVLLSLYEWHLGTGLWDFPKEVHDNDGIIELKPNYEED